MQPFDVFDGITIACGGFCAAMAWVFSREVHKWNLPGFRYLWAAVVLGAWTFMGSVFFGSLVYKGDLAEHLVVTLPALVSCACLIVGFRLYARWTLAPAKYEVGFIVVVIVTAAVYGIVFGARRSADLILSAMFIYCGLIGLARQRREPDSGYGLIALCFLSHPVITSVFWFYGYDIEHMRQLLAIPFTTVSGMMFAVGFANSRDIVSSQLAHIQQVESEMRDLVYMDAATGMRSSHAQRERLTELIEKKTEFSFMIIGLQDFELINNNFGPSTALSVVAAVAARIERVLPDHCELARSSERRLSIIALGVVEEKALQSIVDQILAPMAQPVALSEAHVYVKLSIGAAVHPLHGTQAEELTRNAGIALFAARRQMGSVFCMFEPQMQETGQRDHWLDHNLRSGFESGQFALHYQPKVFLSDGALASVEALLRWTHPQRGNIAPDEFIHRCEANGMIIPLGRWIIETAARQAATWFGKGLAVRVAINLSAKQLADPELLPRLEQAQLIAQGLLDLELTESSFIENEKQIEAFTHSCRELGFGVHLDDFGTGYSSLSRLGNLPLTVLKLDRSFVFEIGRSEKGRALLRSMIGIAHELKLNVVAEGVENEVQADFLRLLGVSQAQGWLYAPAMSAQDLDAWRATLKIGPVQPA
jgi:predicted signal transduction protein with EAL and GGDEF domain